MTAAGSGHVESSSAVPGPARLTGTAALRLHVTLAVGLAVCAAAFSIEVLRALGGNTLSWMYVVEWPLFGAFGIYMWWNLLTGRDRVRKGPSRAAAAPPVDEEKLRAWNRYLGQLDDRGDDGPDPAG